jgi:hypothetical protein
LFGNLLKGTQGITLGFQLGIYDEETLDKKKSPLKETYSKTN